MLVDNKKLADLGASSPCLTAYTKKDDGWQLRNEEALSFAEQVRNYTQNPAAIDPNRPPELVCIGLE